LQGAGIGPGVKDFRAVIIFRKREDMDKFVEKGWEFGGQADAALKTGENGAAYSAAQSSDLDIITYQLTEAGEAYMPRSKAPNTENIRISLLIRLSTNSEERTR